MDKEIIRCPYCGFNRIQIDSIISPCQNCEDPLIQLNARPEIDDMDKEYFEYLENYGNTSKVINLTQFNIININLPVAKEFK